MYEALVVYNSWSMGAQKKIASCRVKALLNEMLSRKCAYDISSMTPSRWKILSPCFLVDYTHAYDVDNTTGPNVHRWHVLCKYFGDSVATSYLEHFGLNHDPYQVWARMERHLGLGPPSLARW